MGKITKQSREVNFGQLGSVEIALLEYDAPDVYAKLFNSEYRSCPSGTPALDSGPTYDDDAGCLAPMMT